MRSSCRGVRPLALALVAGADPEYLSPADFAARANRDFELWGKVISEANIKLE